MTRETVINRAAAIALPTLLLGFLGGTILHAMWLAYLAILVGIPAMVVVVLGVSIDLWRTK